MAIRGRKQAFPGAPIKLMPIKDWNNKVRNLTADEMVDSVKALIKQNPYLKDIDATKYRGTKASFKIEDMHTEHIKNAIKKIKSGKHEHYKNDAAIQTVMLDALERELLKRVGKRATLGKIKKSNIKPADLDGFYFR